MQSSIEPGPASQPRGRLLALAVALALLAACSPPAQPAPAFSVASPAPTTPATEATRPPTTTATIQPAPPAATATPSAQPAPTPPPTTAPAAGFDAALVTAEHHRAAGAEPLLPASVVRVIDGDTIRVRLDGREVTVRYFGIEAPEPDQRCGPEASARNRALVGQRVLLEPGPRAVDRYGRSLYYVYTADGVMVESALIAEGLGTAWPLDGQHRAELIAIEQRARAASVGCLWSR